MPLISELFQQSQRLSYKGSAQQTHISNTTLAFRVVFDMWEDHFILLSNSTQRYGWGMVYTFKYLYFVSFSTSNSLEFWIFCWIFFCKRHYVPPTTWLAVCDVVWSLNRICHSLVCKSILFLHFLFKGVDGFIHQAISWYVIFGWSHSSPEVLQIHYYHLPDYSIMNFVQIHHFLSSQTKSIQRFLHCVLFLPTLQHSAAHLTNSFSSIL